jgi:hypothetical protein
MSHAANNTQRASRHLKISGDRRLVVCAGPGDKRCGGNPIALGRWIALRDFLRTSEKLTWSGLNAISNPPAWYSLILFLPGRSLAG